MPAISGEPFRGLTKIKMDDGLGGRRSFTVSIVDVVPDTATGDQATWEGTPGSLFTLRFEWATTGSPAAGQADTVNIAMRAPGGGSNIGSVWSPAISGASGVITKDFHFDDNPASSSLGTNRAGMLEIYMDVERSAAVAWGPLTSRAGGSVAGNTITWSRGYLRAPVTLSSFSISDASLGGAEPGTFYATKATYNRWDVDAAWYRSAAANLKHRQGTTDIRNGSVTQTTVQRDHTFSAATSAIGGTGRINKDYAAGATLTGIRLSLPSNVFGTDLEYVWAAAGHPASWARTDDTHLDYADRITVDPRLDFDQLLSIGDNAFATPPGSADDAAGERLNADLGFLAARVKDMAGTGLNGIDWTEKLWDNGNLIGTEGSPVKSRSSTSQAQGGQDGWSDAFLVWDNSLPGGQWTQKQVITSADLVGLEVGNTRTLVLLSMDPRISLHMESGDPATPDEHWFPGKPLVVGMGIIKSMVLLTPDADFARLALLRFDPAIGNMRFLDPTDPTLNTWTPVPPSGVVGYFDFDTTPAIFQSPGNAKLILLSLTGAETGQSNWNTFDILVSGVLKFNGVEYPDEMRLISTGAKWKHSSNEPEASITFDPVAGHHHVGTDSRAIGDRS